MKTANKSLYNQFRKAGLKAIFANHASKVLTEFRELESKNLVRVRTEYDEDYRIDWTEDEKVIKFIDNFIDQYGVYGVITEYWDGEEWQIAGSIWGCLYKDCNDPFENDYLVQLMDSAIKEVNKIE